MKISIRQAVNSDAEDIAGLLEELGYPSNRADVEARLNLVKGSSSDAVIVAAIGNRVIAFLSLHVIPYFTTGDLVGRVSTSAVKESARNQGVGRQMMAAAEELAREMSCKALEITSADRREGAHAFYTRLDYPKTSATFFKKLA